MTTLIKVWGTNNGIYRLYALEPRSAIDHELWIELVESVRALPSVSEMQDDESLGHISVLFPPRVSAKNLDKRIFTALRSVVPSLDLPQ